MYEWVKKKWSNTWLYFPDYLIQELQWIVENYLRIMWLDSKKYPARVDIWFSPEWTPVIYEITTGFIDQIGSCLSLQESLWDMSWKESLSSTPFDSTILTSEPYRPEYTIMKKMFEKSWRFLREEWWECKFVYGYPLECMAWINNFFPAWKWLEAEDKLSQSQVIQRLIWGSSFIYPRTFSIWNTNFPELPDEKVTKLIFKQEKPKLKGDRNTIIFWKWKESRRRYEEGEMLAQEFIPSYRDMDGRRFEAKALFMPSPIWTWFTGMYNLVDSTPVSKNFWNMNIPNDGYPQWPGIIIT